MRIVATITIGFFLMSAGHVRAQTTDPFGSGDDPFGSNDKATAQVAPADLKPALSPKNPAPNKTVKQPESPPAALYPHVPACRRSESYLRIERALGEETHFDYIDQPLKDVIEDISFHYQIPIVIDKQSLEDFGIDIGTPITLSLKGIRLRSVLRQMFQDLGLTYVIRDEVLQITTPVAAESSPSTRFYHVAELLPSDGDGKVLVELIKTLIAPDTWCGSDHVGAIVYVEHLESLAIRHTDEVFYKIEGLLAATKQIVENQLPKVSPPTRDPFE